MSMSISRIAIVSAAIVSVGIASLGVNALASPGGSGGATANQLQPAHAQVKPAFQVAGTTSEMSYVPVAPCKLVDTRVHGGAFSSGTVRSYHARGTGSLAAQGGSSTGCGLPQNAAAIATSVTAVSPSGTGFLQLNSSDVSGAGSTIVNYTKNQGITGYTQLDISKPGSAFAFKVTNSGGPTQVLVTVAGYYIAPLQANVDFNGTKLSGGRVVKSDEITGFPGQYEVIFDRDVTKCTYQATSQNQGLTAEVQPRSGNPDGVFVLFTNSSNTVTRNRFYLTVTC